MLDMCEKCNSLLLLYNTYQKQNANIWYSERTLKIEDMSKHTKTEKNIEEQVNLLVSKDANVRRDARKALTKIGKHAVVPLSDILVNSAVYKARWEAAKALGKILDITSIPALIHALEDAESDVAWLAAEALEQFKMQAWPELLHCLVNKGSESVALRNGAHHIVRRQREKGFNNLLGILRKALRSDTISECIPVAAGNVLAKMRVHATHNKDIFKILNNNKHIR